MASFGITCFLLLGIVFFLLPTEVKGLRPRARINDSRLAYKKQGQCPALEVVNRLTNTVCDEADCTLDIDCVGPRKCCYNSCGGKSCIIPIGVEDEGIGRDDEPAVAEIDSQSRALIVNEGETAVFYCNASSRIPTSYGWILVQPGPDLPAINIYPPGSSIGNKRVSSDGRQLTVLGARIQDAANYACVAASLLGYVTKSYHLYVNAATTEPPSTATSGREGEIFQTTDLLSPPGSVEPGNWTHLLDQYLPEVSQKLATTSAPTPETMTSPTSSAPAAEDGLWIEPTTGANSVCYQPRDKGTCSREEERWFFNTSKGKCEIFVYSGCNGNHNNFRSYDECNRTCPSLSETPCEHPIFTGPCRARFMRWGYDSARGECIEFVYGGCRMNGNNFPSREACTSQCIRTQLPFTNINIQSENIEDCRCVRPRLKNCFCSSEFAIEGTVIQKHNSFNGDILVVEVENIYKKGTLSLRKTRTLSNNVTIIRDMSQQGQSCQCHNLEPNSVSYIIMGHVNTRGDAEIDSNSYVSEATPRRAIKLGEKVQRSRYCKLASGPAASDRTSGRRGRARYEVGS